jgi:hypothetical protein
MSSYRLPELSSPPPAGERDIFLVASGDLRHPYNRSTWDAQAEMERKITAAFAAEGCVVRRAHPYDPVVGHGYIYSQRMGMEVFKNIPTDARLIVAEAEWQYSHHVLAGLCDHRGPILTVANWSGLFHGLVGMLQLNGTLIKAGVRFSTIWSETFDDEFFKQGIRQWLHSGAIRHDASHVRPLEISELHPAEVELGQALAAQLMHEKAIFGVFDEGCMGMYNAIIEDDLLNPIGIYKERLSQSALVAAMRTVSDLDADAVQGWLEARGMKFLTGPDPQKNLTDDQIRAQCKMYVAAVRMADEFGCDAIGIQYQQGLKDMAPASDLVEGLLNNPDRPPVFHAETGRALYAGRALPHFNEVDECAGVDILVNDRIWTAMGMDPSSTLHDVRWGEHYRGAGLDDFVWVFMISGGAPASHFIDGYAGASSERQPFDSFPSGGGTLKGISKPGELVWSRVFIENGALHCDLGRATAVELPAEEVARRWRLTTPEWPILNAVLHGVTRDQMMGRHRANHIIVAYAPSAELADKALSAKAAMLSQMGISVHLCGM